MADTPSTPNPRPARIRRSMILVIAAVAVVGVTGVMLYRASAGSNPPQVKLAIITNHEGAFWDPVIKGAMDAAVESNAELVVVRSKPDVQEQIRHLKDVVGQGVDGVAISPINPGAQNAELDEAAAQTVLITFDSDAPNSKRRGFVGTDDYVAGQRAGTEVREAIPDGGGVMVVARSVEMINGRDRRQGLIDELLDRPFKPGGPADPVDAQLKGDKYNIAATVIYGEDIEKAPAVIADAIKRHPDVKCVVGLFTSSAPAILKALEQTGKTGQMQVIGFDEADETQIGLEQGTVFSSILQDQYRCGYEAVRVMANLARGNDPDFAEGPRLTRLFVNVLRKDNLEYMRMQHRIRVPTRSQPTTDESPPATLPVAAATAG